jgi:hypothetical protein
MKRRTVDWESASRKRVRKRLKRTRKGRTEGEPNKIDLIERRLSNKAEPPQAESGAKHVRVNEVRTRVLCVPRVNTAIRTISRFNDIDKIIRIKSVTLIFRKQNGGIPITQSRRNCELPQTPPSPNLNEHFFIRHPTVTCRIKSNVGDIRFRNCIEKIN